MRQRHCNIPSDLQALEAVEVRVSNPSVQLDEYELRALRLAGRRYGGKIVEADAMTGLSGAATLKLAVKSERGEVRASLFSKIARQDKLRVEKANYDQYVGPVLQIGTFPSVVSEIDAGIGKRSALFFQRADEDYTTLFSLLGSDETTSLSVLESVARSLRRSQGQLTSETASIRDLRLARAGDSDSAAVTSSLLDAERTEAKEIECLQAVQHGDLHGSNVLCRSDGTALVVDFGSMTRTAVCLDAVVLELSLLFHPDSPLQGLRWPSLEQAHSMVGPR